MVIKPNWALERTAHTIRLLPFFGVRGHGPPLTVGVRGTERTPNTATREVIGLAAIAMLTASAVLGDEIAQADAVAIAHYLEKRRFERPIEKTLSTPSSRLRD